MEETRQERRERRQRKERAKVPQHGGSLKRVYANAVSKRAGKDSEPGDKAGR